MLEIINRLGIGEWFDNIVVVLTNQAMWWDIGKYGGAALFVFLFFLLLRKTFTRYVFQGIMKIFDRGGLGPGINILQCVDHPLRSLFIILGLFFALLVLPLGDYTQFLVTKAFRVSVIFLVSWVLYNMAGPCLFEAINSKINAKMDDILVPFISKVLRFLVIFLGISLVASETGFNVTGFITGLGLGGLAFALAAQDTAANIFGGIVIITDKPFDIGDWIYTPSVEGTVEDISFRSTRIRTFANSLVTVPNSTLAKEAVNNWSRMGKRRVTFNLGVTYDTPREKLKKCVEEIKDLLQNHSGVQQDLLFVKFDSFNDSSLDIFIYYFTITTNWGEFLDVKEDINFNIMKILEEQGVSVAFPSRSIYLETPVDLHSSQTSGEKEKV